MRILNSQMSAVSSAGPIAVSKSPKDSQPRNGRVSGQKTTEDLADDDRRRGVDQFLGRLGGGN